MGKGYKVRRSAIMLSMAVCIGLTGMTGVAWADEPTAAPAASEPAAAATSTEAPPAEATEASGGEEKAAKKEKTAREEKAAKRLKKEEQGYYQSIQTGREELESGREKKQKKKKNDGGYYTEIPSTPINYPTPPKVEPPPVVATPQPVVVPPRPVDPNARKFDDDTGKTGSILATRHAKQAKELLQSGHYDLAKKHFKESLRDFPDQADLYPGYWECCQKTNDWSEAMRALNKMFDLNPAWKKDYSWALGQALFELRRWDNAVPVLKDALKYGKNQEEIHTYLLKIAQHEKNTPQIVAEYQALIKLKPGDYKMQLDLANLLELDGKHAEALARYKSASALNPSDGALMGRIAYMMMYYNKDFAGAIPVYQRAASVDPANAAKYNGSIKYCMQQIKLAKRAKVGL